MSLGLGKRYWVRVVKHHFGDIRSCLNFMSENIVEDGHQWFELRPLPVVKNGNVEKCVEYSCDLVEDAR